MNRYNINLGHDWILPLRARCLIHRTMRIYLTASGLFLILAVYGAELNIRRAAACRDEACMIRAQFNQVPSGLHALQNYANQLQAQIQFCTQQAQAIHEALPSNLHTVLPLLNFLVSQSNGSSLDKLTLIQEEGKDPVIEFSLAVPARGRKNPGPEIFQKWQQNKELEKCFASITPVTTRLGRFGDDDVFVVNYRAIFKE